MIHRLSALAAALVISLGASALPSPAVADAKPRKVKAHKGSYAGADGRKNH